MIPFGKFGKLAPRTDPLTDPSVMQLRARHLAAADQLLPDLPAAKNFGDQSDFRDPLGNNDCGDCTVAMVGQYIAALCQINGVPNPVTADEIVRIYNKLTGGIDSGLFLRDVLDYAATEGICGYKLAGYAAVDWHDRALMAKLSGLFGGLLVGAQIADVQFNQEVWDYVAYSKFVGRHAIYRPGHSPAMGNYITWGYRLDATEAWEENQLDECYVGYIRELPPPCGLDADELWAMFARL